LKKTTVNFVEEEFPRRLRLRIRSEGGPLFTMCEGLIYELLPKVPLHISSAGQRVARRPKSFKCEIYKALDCRLKARYGRLNLRGKRAKGLHGPAAGIIHVNLSVN
jgi:hypothetical protein